MTAEPIQDQHDGSSDGAVAQVIGRRPLARRPFARTAAWGLAALLVALAVGEWAGWPWLAAPLQNWLAQRLDRNVQLTGDATGTQGARFRFLGSVRAQVPVLRIDAASWQGPSAAPTVQATGVELALRYGDLWRAWRGGDLRLQALSAVSLDVVLERRSDGRTSWQFGPVPPQDARADPGTLARLPTIGELQVNKGTVHWMDAPNDADVRAELALTAAIPDKSRAAGGTSARGQLSMTAQGRVRQLPLALEVRADGALPLLSDEPRAATRLRIDGTWGSSALEFDGTAVDVLRASQASGRFLLKGPSLAAVGDPFGVTLPTTTEFRAVGQVVRRGQKWQIVFDDATVGSSKLKGAFEYDAGASLPVLSGQLTGMRLHLADLGPAVGGRPDAPRRAAGKMLPDRSFDLPSLRVMQANILIDVQEVDLDTDLLEPLRPLRAHLILTDGVLRINSIDARTAQGRLQGSMQLDGRQEQALWKADLRWSGVELGQWIHQDRTANLPPYVSGKLDGSVQWTGRGKSTAQILGSLNGPMRVFLRQGKVSHLAVEVAGIDLFQSLGLLIVGDERLPIRCAAAEMTATDGSIRPTVFVVDTDDSVLVVDGMVSLAQESMDLRVAVMPKDFSVLTLRSPLHVQGGFADPKVSVESSALGAKLAGSVLLGLINPLAALIPLIDPGNASATAEASADCRALAGRIASRPAAVKGAQPSR